MTLVNKKARNKNENKEEKKIMKKNVVKFLTAAMIGTTVFASAVSAAPSGTITVVSREDGSGTRGAFIELFGVQEEQDG